MSVLHLTQLALIQPSQFIAAKQECASANGGAHSVKYRNKINARIVRFGKVTVRTTTDKNNAGPEGHFGPGIALEAKAIKAACPSSTAAPKCVTATPPGFHDPGISPALPAPSGNSRKSAQHRDRRGKCSPRLATAQYPLFPKWPSGTFSPSAALRQSRLRRRWRPLPALKRARRKFPRPKWDRHSCRRC